MPKKVGQVKRLNKGAVPFFDPGKQAVEMSFIVLNSRP